ncbi:aldose epimerase family protein [Halomonas garicola]|uniref:aldose epimerase family protein n=1 Tax=Halomonas garicola TaxID=1690008 RepID=UPI0028981ADF|nr:D-hexose-6-phosphate mutarotase [Halomonas garicola]
MIPDSLQERLDATDDQQTLTWEGRELVLFNQPWGQLAVALTGAQVVHFKPAGDTPWLWLTPTPAAAPATLRGGIPLCWPWFGDERYADESPNRQGPFHGTARLAPWRLDGVDEHEEGIEVHLSPEERLHGRLTVRVVIQANARRLHVELISENVGDAPVKTSAALHTYLAVDDAFACRLEGLAGARYLDKHQGFAEGEQQGTLAPSGAVDRIYHSNAAVRVHDGRRTLLVAKDQSDSTVVWHPGEAPPDDTSPAAARGFLCVEAANTRLDPVWLVSGAQHLLGTTLTRPPAEGTV